MNAFTSSIIAESSNSKILWPESSSVKQSFTFPGPIIYYMMKNPSTPKCYLKLAKSCKCFFEKNPILIVAQIHDDGKKLCSSKKHCLLECRNDGNKGCCINVQDLTKLTSKIWLTDGLDLCVNKHKYVSSSILPKLYKCDSDSNFALLVSKTSLIEMTLFATKFQKIFIFKSEITYNDKSLAMLDVILKAIIPHVKEFVYQFNDEIPAFNVSTIKNITKLKDLGNLKHFYLINIPEIFAVEDFANFSKAYKNIILMLNFNDRILSDAYKAQLDQFIDNIVQTDVQNCIIWYAGQDEEKLKIMTSRCIY